MSNQTTSITKLQDTAVKIIQDALKILDEFANKLTMHKLLLWGLRVLFGISWLFSAVGTLPYGPVRPLISISILIAVCLGSNWIISRWHKFTVNGDSSNITALLLYFIFQPPKNVKEGLTLGLAGLIAIVSKYVITYKQRLIFNPASFGAMVVGLTGILTSRWWIGRDTMFIFVVILAFILIRKIHRFPMVIAFGVTATILAIIRSDAALSVAIKDSILAFPIIFFGSFMLSEPATTPPRRYQQVAYGLLVGLLFSSGFRVGSITMTPEISLILGNLAVFAVIRRLRQPLKLIESEEIGRSIWQYKFKPVNDFNFKPGQYLEVTLPIKKSDARGNRRSFSIASSPTEKEVLLGIKHYQPSSAYKTYLNQIEKGTVVDGNNIAGDFLLPIDDRAKMVFIAGGIGITPFRSMLKYLTDTRQGRNITLFYCVGDQKQIVYKDVLKDAEEYGLKSIFVLNPPKGEKTPQSWKGEIGILDAEMIKKNVLDYKDRIYYISGPDAMVQANKQLLKKLHIPRDQIKTDYFSGY